MRFPARAEQKSLPGLGTALAITATLGCSDTPTAPDRNLSCPGDYPAQATSPYVLPYQVGRSFTIGQGNCGQGSHAPGTAVQFAYDFLMPTGTEIVAARAGEVLLLEERFADGTRIAGEENYINILHEDGTIAAYVHLTMNGSLVRVGDLVRQGK